MTAIVGQGNGQKLDFGHSTKPVVLSTIQFPLRPSTTSPKDSSAKYHHILTSKAINPRMDLVAILSRDVAPSSAVATGGSASNPSALFGPPPPGMSAAANQARMKMMMMARARALAAGGKAPPAMVAQAEVPKVTRSASLRLSLWRMASMAGEQGSRVWDVDVKVPDLFKDAGKDIKELENMNVTAMQWDPNGRSIALAIQATRSRVEVTPDSRYKRFLIIFGMQDGKQQRVIQVPSDDEKSSSVGLYGMEWCDLDSTSRLSAVVS